MNDILQQPVSEILKYRDVASFWRINNLPERRARYNGQVWRLADQSVGYVRGLSRLSGWARVTDGVLLIVEGEDGKMFDCHLESWVDCNAGVKVGNSGNSSGGISKTASAKRAQVFNGNSPKVSLEALADLLK